MFNYLEYYFHESLNYLNYYFYNKYLDNYCDFLIMQLNLSD